MSSYRDRLEDEVNRLGVTFVSQKTGVARNTVYNWLAKGNVPLNYLVVLGSLGADVIYVVTGQRSNAKSISHLPGEDLGSNPPASAGLTADELELLELFRAATLSQKMEAVAVLTGGTKKKASRPKPAESAGVNVRGSGNRAAGRDYHEKE